MFPPTPSRSLPFPLPLSLSPSPPPPPASEPSAAEPTTAGLVAFSDLRTAAYCPRQCYYRRRDRSGGTDDRGGSGDVGESDEREASAAAVERIRSLADRYTDLLEMEARTLASEPIAVDPATYRRNLESARSRLEAADRWESFLNPVGRDVLSTGKDCRGIVHKVLAEPVAPSLVSIGSPPDNGVWEPQSVHAVAAAKALAWERRTPIDVAYLEYPRYGVIRTVELTTRRKALYRRALRTVREMDGPPARVRNRSKCDSCEYAPECGVRTRTLRSLLGVE